VAHSTDCIFSGEPADSEEHVIPKWLQRRFNLWNQTLALPNGTTSPYRQVKVPVRTEHNGRFSAIEASIAQGNFPKHEAYLWALKIHIGLIYRDARLKIARSHPASPSILNVDDFATEVSMFRQLYDIWRQGGTTDPSPFGSVYVFDSFVGPSEFDFFHCMTTGTVGVNLGDKFVVVFLWDQGDAYRANTLDMWEKYHLQVVANAPAEKRREFGYVAHHVWACESAYWLWRHRRPFNFVRFGNTLLLIPPGTRPPGEPSDRETYERICPSFRLKLEVFNGEVANVYSIADPKFPD
jgi:hypothetical protein